MRMKCVNETGSLSCYSPRSSVGGAMMMNSSDEQDDDEILTDGDELDEACVAQLRVLINEIIRKCGDKWCLYTKHVKNGKRRRLGTHDTRAGAENQEKAIHSHH